MNASNNDSLLKKIKDPKSRAELFNYILKDTNIYQEPLVSVVTSLQGIYEVMVALFILAGSLLLNTQVKNSQDQVL